MLVNEALAIHMTNILKIISTVTETQPCTIPNKMVLLKGYMIGVTGSGNISDMYIYSIPYPYRVYVHV